MTDRAYTREVQGLESDKNIGKIQIDNYRNGIVSELMGDMGKDIDEVLTRKKVITGVKKEPFYKKIIRKFDEILKMF